MTCTHAAVLQACLSGSVPETGAPIYSPTTETQLVALIEHVGCWAEVPVEQPEPAPEPVYGKCLSCGAIETRLNRATTTLDYSGIGESNAYPAGYGCEFCG